MEDPKVIAERHEAELETYISALRSKGIRRNYREGISWVTQKEPDAFLDLARKDRRRAEAYLIGFISRKRDELDDHRCPLSLRPRLV